MLSLLHGETWLTSTYDVFAAGCVLRVLAPWVWSLIAPKHKSPGRLGLAGKRTGARI